MTIPTLPRAVCSVFLIPAAVACVSEPRLPGDDEVLASVNGAPVTRFDLESAARETLGNLGEVALERPVQRQLLEGLSRSRAIAIVAAADLPPKDVVAIERRAAAVRERLLVKAYLERYGALQAPSEQELRKYYELNAAMFGARRVRTVAVLTGTARSPSEVASMTAALGLLRSKVWDGPHGASAAGFVQSLGRVEDLGLPSRVSQASRSLEETETSQPIIDGDRVFLIRLVDDAAMAARPFQEVRDEILRKLEPRSYKRAAERVADAIEGRVEIVLY